MTRPVLKKDAENVVKRVEGVEKVVNNIEVLPLSPADDDIRIATYRSIFGHPALNRYAIQPQPPIRIIVKNGNVTLIGVVNIPIIHYSVEWWSTLHQGPTISKLDNPSITANMLWPLLVMIAGFTLFFLAVLTRRVQGEVLEREQHARWAQEIIAGAAG